MFTSDLSEPTERLRRPATDPVTACASAGNDTVRGYDPWRAQIGIVLQESKAAPGPKVRERLDLNAAYYRAPRPVDETLPLVALATATAFGVWAPVRVAEHGNHVRAIGTYQLEAAGSRGDLAAAGGEFRRDRWISGRDRISIGSRGECARELTNRRTS
jgi:hypothetical protein